MSRILSVVAIVALGAALAGCSTISRGGGPPPGPPPAQPGSGVNAKEFAILHVGMIPGDTGTSICGLLQNPPDAILTHKAIPGQGLGAGQAEWIVVGNCGPSDTISISPDLTMGGQVRRNVIQPVGPGTVPAQHGSRLRAVVLPSAADGDYGYEVRINGEAAQTASPADRGLFAICPDWPCRRSG